MNVASSIVRRGLEAHATHGEDIQKNIPVWGVLMLVVTFAVFAFAMFNVRYY